MMIAVIFSVPAAFSFICKNLIQVFSLISFIRIFGFPFFDSTEKDEVFQLNRDFHMDFETIHTIKTKLLNSSEKIDKEGNFNFCLCLF